MDQLRTALGWLKRQHFWVLSVLAALIALGCWWTASGSMKQAFEANQTQIKSEFSSLDTLRNASFHANERVNEAQAAEAKKQAEDVQKIWEQLYDRQREHVLKWPSALSQEFRDFVEGKQFGASIPPLLRNNYQNYVERHFESLPKRIGARPLSEEEMGSMMGGEGMFRGRTFSPESMMTPGGMPMVDDGDYICEWLDQELVRRDLDFPQQPSALRIWWTQENLWVYETLLDVIAKTNDAANASRRSNAAVKVVHSMQVGKRAAPFSRQKGRIYTPPSTASPVEPGMEGGEMPPMGEMPPEGMPMEGGEMAMMGMGEGTMGAMSPEQEKMFLFHNRYLDAAGKPLPFGGGGGEAMPVDPTMPADPSAGAPAGAIDPSMFGVEYKRLPVRMVLEMDQRYLPRLIAECASQPLQVEVQEVRVNVPDALSGTTGGGMPFGGSPEGGMGFAGGSVFQESQGIQGFSPQSNIVTVVVQGVIYIFNPPNPTKLQIDEAGAEDATQTAGL